MLRRFLVPLLALGLLGWYAQPAKAAPHGLVEKVTGTVTSASQSGSFTGVMYVQKLTFANDPNMIMVVGVLNGVVTFADGTTKNLRNVPITTKSSLSTSSTSARAAAAASCSVLTLNTGAIHLDLLGLVVNIAPISINVTALPFGGLLGSLLCSLSGLLSGGPFLPVLQDLTLINELLSAL